MSVESSTNQPENETQKEIAQQLELMRTYYQKEPINYQEAITIGERLQTMWRDNPADFTLATHRNTLTQLANVYYGYAANTGSDNAGDYIKAGKVFDQLKDSFPEYYDTYSNNSRAASHAYFKAGQLNAATGDYSAAADNFITSLNRGNKQSTEWYLDTCTNLIPCYRNLSESPHASDQEKASQVLTAFFGGLRDTTVVDMSSQTPTVRVMPFSSDAFDRLITAMPDLVSNLREDDKLSIEPAPIISILETRLGLFRRNDYTSNHSATQQKINTIKEVWTGLGNERHSTNSPTSTVTNASIAGEALLATPAKHINH